MTSDQIRDLIARLRVLGDYGPDSPWWVCPDVDEGLMATWFANAIETGRSAGRFQFGEHMRAAVDAVYFGHFPPETEPALIDGAET